MPLTKDHITDALALMDSLTISASDTAFEDLARRLESTNSSQKDDYQNAWSKKVDHFETGQDTCGSMSELLDHVGGIPNSNGLIIGAIASNQIKIGKGAFSPTPGHMVIVRDGRYEMVPNATSDSRLVEAVLNAVTDQTQAIVELGCGWGRNLASTAIKTPRRDFIFVGLEQAKDGLLCTEKLLSKDPCIKYRTAHFDFYDPDYFPLSEFSDIVVFSCAAIEQITFIGAKFIDEVMAIADNVTLILYEPIGWQRNKVYENFALHTALSEIMENIPVDKQHVLNYIFDLDDQVLEQNAVSWSVCAKYNLNLWSVIENALSRDVVDLKSAAFDIFGVNPFNPYSLIVLEKRDIAS